MTTKLVLRLFDAENRLLGDTVVYALVRGDGCLRAPGPVAIQCDAAGVPACVSIHWADYHTETRVPMPPLPLMGVGAVVPLYAANDPLVQVGTVPGPLPPVTMRQPVAVGIPKAMLGSVGNVSLVGTIGSPDA
jgi:hypothetical protein